MKATLTSSLAAAAFALAATAAALPVRAATSVGVSIGINQPGVYGRINIGSYPQPEVVYAQPVLVAPPRYAVPRQPIYLYVAPGEERDWRRYCGRYAACEQPVYFVRDQWVRDRYAHEHPGWRERGDRWRQVRDRRDDRGYYNDRDGRDDRGGRGDRGDRDHRGGPPDRR